MSGSSHFLLLWYLDERARAHIVSNVFPVEWPLGSLKVTSQFHVQEVVYYMIFKVKVK